MGLFNNTVKIRPGMTFEELKNTLEQKEYKSEKCILMSSLVESNFL